MVLVAGDPDKGGLVAIAGALHSQVARDHPAARVDVARQASARLLPLEGDRLAREAQAAQRLHRLRALVGGKVGVQLAAIKDLHRLPAQRFAHVDELLLARPHRVQLLLDARIRRRQIGPRRAARIEKGCRREAWEVAADDLVVRVLVQFLGQRLVVAIMCDILAYTL